MTRRPTTTPREIHAETATPTPVIASGPSLDRHGPAKDTRPVVPSAVPGRRRPASAPVRTVPRWLIVVVVFGHGLIHLLGAAKGLGWAEVATLPEPIDPAIGVAWLTAAAAGVSTAILLAVRNRNWWIAGVVSVVASQAVILTSWNDAKTGTLANVLLLAALGYTFASRGPKSYRAEYQHRTAAALIESYPNTRAVVTETDLAHLPSPVAEYVRRSGAVGQPHVRSVHAKIHGRIRAGANSPWMTYTGEQVNTYGTTPRRFFSMDATLFGLPIDVLHIFSGATATMRVKLCSVVPMVNAAGPDMDRAETVTLFNDLCILTPAALIDAPITWQPIDDTHIRGTFTNGSQTVTADLTFHDGDLINFVSDDRMSTSRDGSTTPQRWSTPIGDYRTFGARRIATYGEGHWHTTDPQSQYAYLEYNLDAITINPLPTADLEASNNPSDPTGSKSGGPATTELRSGYPTPPTARYITRYLNAPASLHPQR